MERTDLQAITEAQSAISHRILVALDKTTGPSLVLQKTQELATVWGGHLMLCHCLTGPMPASSEMFATGSLGMYGSPYTPELLAHSEQLLREQRQQVCSDLRALQAQLSTEQLAVEFDCQSGDPGQYICQLAKAWQANLIVVGRRGRRGISEMVMGSVSNYVVHHAHCSVLVVQ